MLCRRLESYSWNSFAFAWSIWNLFFSSFETCLVRLAIEIAGRWLRTSSPSAVLREGEVLMASWDLCFVVE